MKENPNVYRIFGKDWTAENCFGKELDCNYQTEFVTRELHDKEVLKVKELERSEHYCVKIVVPTLESEVELLKQKLSMCKDKYYMLVNACEWYADKGTEQERHHFLKVEALGNYNADMQEIEDLK